MIGIIGAIIALATVTLQYLETKLAHKYRDELTDIETQYRAAINVEYRLRDHAAIDALEFRLQQCIRNLTTDATLPGK